MRVSLRNVRTFESFKIPSYRVYFVSTVGQWLTLSMQTIVRSLLVYTISDSAAVIGIVALAQAMPQLIFSLLGGAIADKIPKKYLLTIGRSSSAAVAAGVALALITGYLSPVHPESWWILVVSSALQGTATGLTRPALISIIPELVDSKQVMNAISLSSMGQNVFRLIGPTVAGFLVQYHGYAVVYFFMTGLYLMDTVWTLFLPRTTATATGRKSSPIRDIIDAFKYIRRETVFLLIVIFALCHVIAGQPYMQLLPVFTVSILHVGAEKLGILSSVSAVGALLGSLVFASLPNKYRGMLLIYSGVIMGLGVIVFSFSHSWALSLALMPLLGLGPTMHSTMTNTLIQSYAQPDYRGRTQAFTAMASGLATFGTFTAGIVADAIGVEWAVGSMAIFLLAVSIFYLAFVPRVRKLD